MEFIVSALVLGAASAVSAVYYSLSKEYVISPTGSDTVMETVDDFKDIVTLDKIRTIPDTLKDELLNKRPVLKNVQTKVASLDTQSYMFDRINRDIRLYEQRHRLKRVKPTEKGNTLIDEMRRFRREQLKPVGPIVRLAATTKRHPVHNELLNRKKYV